MENSRGGLTPLDELYLQRAYELAARAIGSTSPNPPVGAVVVRDGREGAAGRQSCVYGLVSGVEHHLWPD